MKPHPGVVSYDPFSFVTDSLHDIRMGPIVDLKEYITRCKLTIISWNQMFVRNSLDKFGPMRPVYRFLMVIHLNAMLLFFLFISYT
jgi:hypothetical protein